MFDPITKKKRLKLRKLMQGLVNKVSKTRQNSVHGNKRSYMSSVLIMHIGYLCFMYSSNNLAVSVYPPSTTRSIVFCSTEAPAFIRS